MPNVRSILVISNGHGEDIIAASLIRQLLSIEKGLWIKVLPVVGEGCAYNNLPVKIHGPRRKLPSGGFMRQNVKNFVDDVSGGLLKDSYEQIQEMRKVRKDVDMVICVGDVLLVTLAGLFVRKPMIFLPTAKSEYISGHYSIEKRLMRKYTTLVLPRDQKTAEELQKAGINAEFVGNAMMDSFQITGMDFGIEEGANVVGLLPGSRNEAYQNMLTLLQVVEYLDILRVEQMDYLISIADQISLDYIERSVNEFGWSMTTDLTLLPEGVAAILESVKGTRVKLVKSYFGDLLEKSDIFIGLAGTANEQAVGMGKPLITFPGEGPQFNEKFLQAQKKLLGDSILVVEPNPEKIATELLVILHDHQRYQEMGEIGLQRMGSRGGIRRMCDMILEVLNFRN